MGTKRYRYATATLSLTKFDHTTGKVLNITTSLTKRSEKYRWGSGTGSITEIKVGAKTYDLFCEYGQFTVEELTAHIKVYVDVENKRAEQKMRCSRNESLHLYPRELEPSSTPFTKILRPAGWYMVS